MCFAQYEDHNQRFLCVTPEGTIAVNEISQKKHLLIFSTHCSCGGEKICWNNLNVFHASCCGFNPSRHLSATQLTLLG